MIRLYKCLFLSICILLGKIAFAPSAYSASPDDVFSSVVVLNEYTGSSSAPSRPVVYKTTDGGISWTSSQNIGSSGYIRAVTCQGNDGKTCAGVGDIYTSNTATFVAYASSNAGATWSNRSIASHAGASAFNGVTCKDKSCVGVGGYSKPTGGVVEPIAYTSIDSGNSWVVNYPPILGTLGSSLRTVSCSGNDGQFCTAIGDYNSGYDDANQNNTTTFVSYVSNDRGNSWISYIMEKQLGVSQIKSMDCDDETGQNCVAVGYLDKHQSQPTRPIIYKSSNGGVNWTPYIPEQEFGGQLHGVTCNGSHIENCVAVGFIYNSSNKVYGIIYTTTDGGANWTSQDFAPLAGTNSSGFATVACSDDNQYCIAIASSVCTSISSYCNESQKRIPVVYRSDNYANDWDLKIGFTDYNSIWKIEKAGISISASSE